jgi:hypothetical protein
MSNLLTYNASNGTTVSPITAFPGAWFINAGDDGYTLPIFSSLANFTNCYGIDFQDKDDYYIVMPGFKLIVYRDINYAGTEFTIDATSSKKPVMDDTPNNNIVSSCKLYFGSTEITTP